METTSIRQLNASLTELLAAAIEFSPTIRLHLDDRALEYEATKLIDDWVASVIRENLHRPNLAPRVEAILSEAQKRVLKNSWGGPRWSQALVDQLRHWRMICHRIPI